jgi:hypothetical protein
VPYFELNEVKDKIMLNKWSINHTQIQQLSSCLY